MLSPSPCVRHTSWLCPLRLTVLHRRNDCVLRNAKLLADGPLHSTCRRRRCHPWGSPQRAEGLPAPRMTVTMTAMKPAGIQKYEHPILELASTMCNPLALTTKFPAVVGADSGGSSNDADESRSLQKSMSRITSMALPQPIADDSWQSSLRPSAETSGPCREFQPLRYLWLHRPYHS